MPGFLKDFFDKKGKKGVQNLIVMLLVGVVLLVVSAYFANLGGGDDGADVSLAQNVGDVIAYQTQTLEQRPAVVADLAGQLEEILSLVSGAGQVRVMLTMGSGASIFAQDSQENTAATTEEDGEGGVRNVESINSSITYVMVRQSDGSEAPLLLTQIVPDIEGIIIVAQGGGDVVVREALTRAAQALLGVAPHRVMVLQMQ